MPHHLMCKIGADKREDSDGGDGDDIVRSGSRVPRYGDGSVGEHRS